MIDTQLNQQVLLDTQLHQLRLVVSVPTIELHKLIIGITSSEIGDIALSVIGDRLMARGHSTENWRSEATGGDLYSRSFAKHEFALENLHFVVTQGFLNGILLKIRKFGVEGGHELVHFFVSNDEKITSDKIINELSVLIPPNQYHQNPVETWTRTNTRSGIRLPKQDAQLFDQVDLRPLRGRIILPLGVLRYLPPENHLLAKSNGQDRWRFHKVQGTAPLIEVQREDWFRVIYKPKASTTDPRNLGSNFSVENLPALSDRALTVLADRAVYR